MRIVTIDLISNANQLLLCHETIMILVCKKHKLLDGIMRMEPAGFPMSELIHADKAILILIQFAKISLRIMLVVGVVSLVLTGCCIDIPLSLAQLSVFVCIPFSHLLHRMNFQDLWMNVWVHQVCELILIQLAIFVLVRCMELCNVCLLLEGFLFIRSLMEFGDLFQVLFEGHVAIRSRWHFVEDSCNFSGDN